MTRYVEGWNRSESFMLSLTGRLAPDFKTIADFRRDNGPAIKATCRQFVLLCRKLDLFADSLVAIDGSKFKAVTRTLKRISTEMSLQVLAYTMISAPPLHANPLEPRSHTASVGSGLSGLG